MTVDASEAADLAKTMGAGGDKTFDVYDQGRGHGARRPDYGSMQKASQKHIQKNLPLQHNNHAKLAKAYSQNKLDGRQAVFMVQQSNHSKFDAGGQQSLRDLPRIGNHGAAGGQAPAAREP